MKKITFILFALIAGTTFAQDSDTGSADVYAEIVSPISISAGSALNFGRIYGTAGGGIVTVDANIGNTTSGATTLFAPGGIVSSAVFTVVAAPEYTYSIDFSSSDVVLKGTEVTNTMAIDFFSNKALNTNLGSGGDDLLYVGGNLTVASGQAPDNYQGTVKVTVAYE